MLGGFEVRRGKHLVAADQWKREKARQLLQTLALSRTKGISEEQLSLYFWPSADEFTINNNFKVTLSALNQALEPDRPSRENPVFVIRNGDHYQLNPHIQYFLDLDEFEKLALSPNLNEREEALLLYKGRLLEGEVFKYFFLPEMQYFHLL